MLHRVLLPVLALLCLGGCAVGFALRDDGTPDPGRPVVGLAWGSTAAASIGKATGTVLGALGVPGAQAIGTGIASVLTLFGVGGTAAAMHYRGKSKGVDQGYAEKEADAARERERLDAEYHAGRADAQGRAPVVVPSTLPAGVPS